MSELIRMLSPLQKRATLVTSWNRCSFHPVGFERVSRLSFGIRPPKTMGNSSEARPVMVNQSRISAGWTRASLTSSEKPTASNSTILWLCRAISSMSPATDTECAVVPWFWMSKIWMLSAAPRDRRRNSAAHRIVDNCEVEKAMLHHKMGS